MVASLQNHGGCSQCGLCCEQGSHIARQGRLSLRLRQGLQDDVDVCGPLAESPVTASMCFSSTTTVFPTMSNSAQAVSTCFRSANFPLHSAVSRRPARTVVWHGTDDGPIDAERLFDLTGGNRSCRRIMSCLAGDVGAYLFHHFLNYLRASHKQRRFGVAHGGQIVRCQPRPQVSPPGHALALLCTVAKST